MTNKAAPQISISYSKVPQIHLIRLSFSWAENTPYTDEVSLYKIDSDYV